MLLVALLVAPFAAALLACFTSGRDGDAASRLGLALSLVVFAIGLPLVVCCTAPIAVSWHWFTLWGTGAGVDVALRSDGLSAWLIQLVTLLTPLAILASRQQVGARMREFVVAVLALEGLMIGALLANNLVIFYLFYEGMLLPMVVLIALFGGAERRAAAVQFFCYTMLGSIGLLVAIWYVAAVFHTTDATVLMATLAKAQTWLAENRGDDALVRATTLDPGLRAAVGFLAGPAGWWCFIAFALAFAVKVPLMPLHGWQARTYAECPAGAAILLAGAMAKVGVYGLLRFVLPIFPWHSATAAPWFIALGLIGVIAGALIALTQSDVKRMIAFSSLSHLGLVVVGIFTFTPTALNGAAVQMVAHGLSVAALFLLVGYVERRSERRGLDDHGGLADQAPVFAVLLVIAALVSAALPGTATFVGEFMLLFGIFDPARWWIAAIAGLSTIFTAVYLLRLVQRWLYGEPCARAPLADLNAGEVLAVVPLLVLALAFGLYPTPISRQAGTVAAALAEPAAKALQTPSAITSVGHDGAATAALPAPITPIVTE